MACWPDLFYWTSNGPTPRAALPGDGTVADGSILLYIEGSDDGYTSELQHEFKLVLTDDPASGHGGRPVDVLELLEQFYEHIVQPIVFPRIFTIMSAQPGSALNATRADVVERLRQSEVPHRHRHCFNLPTGDACHYPRLCRRCLRLRSVTCTGPARRRDKR
jgi:hypothetical protein